MEKYFYELPIYRCSPEKHFSNLNDLENKITNDLGYVAIDYPEKFEKVKNNRYARESYPYEYNETIGWIRLYILGNQIRGEYYFETDPIDRRKNKVRFDKGIRKKRFELYGKAFELTIKKELNSNQISDLLLKKLTDLSSNEIPFKGRYIDTRQLENIISFIDWLSLMRVLNPFK